jgi:hypothetical protein
MTPHLRIEIWGTRLVLWGQALVGVVVAVFEFGFGEVEVDLFAGAWEQGERALPDGDALAVIEELCAGGFIGGDASCVEVGAMDADAIVAELGALVVAGGLRGDLEGGGLRRRGRRGRGGTGVMSRDDGEDDDDRDDDGRDDTDDFEGGAGAGFSGDGLAAVRAGGGLLRDFVSTCNAVNDCHFATAGKWGPVCLCVLGYTHAGLGGSMPKDLGRGGRGEGGPHSWR